MLLPGFFIEYLVTGSCALPWLFGLGRLFVEFNPRDLDKAWIAALAPSVYVLGMLIDSCSREALKVVRDHGRRSHPKIESEFTFSVSPAAVWARSAELGKQADMRSSRDRIARGAVGNILAGTIVSAICAIRFSWPLPWWSVLIVGYVVTILTAGMWLRFDRLTEKYLGVALRALEEAKPSKTA